MYEGSRVSQDDPEAQLETRLTLLAYDLPVNLIRRYFLLTLEENDRPRRIRSYTCQERKTYGQTCTVIMVQPRDLLILTFRTPGEMIESGERNLTSTDAVLCLSRQNYRSNTIP